MPVLPIAEAVYYLKSTSRKTYIKGASDWQYLSYVDTPDSDCKFKFVEFGGFTYLQHYNTNKWVSTLRLLERNFLLGPNNDPMYHNLRVAMVTIEGNTYLRNAENSNSYFHPQDDIAKPGNTILYWDGHNPLSAIELEPAEDYTIKSITFTPNPALNESVLIGTSNEIINNTGNPIEQTFTISYGESLTNEFSFSFSQEFSVSVSTSVSAGVKIVDASTTVTVGFKFGATQTKTTSTTSNVQVTYATKYTVPPGMKGFVTSTTRQKSGDIPFTAVLKSPQGREITIDGTMYCKYFYDQVQSLNTVTI